MTVPPFDALVAKTNEELAKAQAKHQLLNAVLSALTPTAAAPVDVYDFGYCADASLTFEYDEAALPGLLAAYPPEELVYVLDGSLTQKPRSYLRDTEELNAAILELGPVLHKTARSMEPELIWWTKLSSGHMARVSVRKAPASVFQALLSEPRYTLDSHSYSTGNTAYGLRALAPAETVKPAMLAWHDAWEAFAAEHGWAGGQMQFLKAIRSFTVQPMPWNWVDEGLPEPMSPLRLGAALAVPKGREIPEYLEELQAKVQARKEHWMDRVGDFWRYFSREEADAFWAFCLRMHAQLPQAMAADEAQARQVASVFEELLAEGYPSSDDRLTWERLRHVTRHRTKLNADLRLSSVNRHTGDVCLEMRLTGLTYLGWHRFGMKAGKVRPLKPQHIAVTYVD